MNDILIIGAGVAGMAAAEYCRLAGREVTLVDKAARPGGRCATRRIAPEADADWFDYGAQYFTARSDTFRRSVEGDLAANRLVHWQPAIHTAEALGNGWLLSPSPDDQERLIGPRGLNHWVRDRLDAIDQTVACERRVNSLRRGDDAWTARFDAGPPVHARHVLLSAPASQTKALLGPHARGLAPLARADRALSACHSLVVRAPALADIDAIFFKAGPLSWAADNTAKAGRAGHSHLWTLHADAEFSDARVETRAEDLAEPLIETFARATACDKTDIELVRAHRWRYARPGPGAPDAEQRCWVEPEAGLALAGDWLAGGRVEGAWLSGRGAAARLIGDV